MRVKLSATQQRAYNKLKKHGGWECSYTLRESMATLNALVKKGLAVSRGHGRLGAFWSPQTTIEYKVVGGKG